MDRRREGREQIRERLRRGFEWDLGYLANPYRKADVARQRSSSERVEEKLRAFEGTGLLSGAEAAEWRERFLRADEAVAAADEEVATPDVRARAAASIEAHLAELGPGNGNEPIADEPACFHSLVSALKAVGALSEQDERSFRERRDSILGRPKPAAPPGPAPPPPELLRVAVGPSERKGGVRVTAAELFTEFVRLWWHRTISPEELAELDREQVLDEGKGLPATWQRAAERFELSDDLGTRYQAEVHGSDEDTPWLWLTMWRIKPEAPEPLPLFGRAIFTPAVPEEATRLEAVDDAHRFVIDLSS